MRTRFKSAQPVLTEPGSLLLPTGDLFIYFSRGLLVELSFTLSPPTLQRSTSESCLPWHPPQRHSLGDSKAGLTSKKTEEEVLASSEELSEKGKRCPAVKAIKSSCSSNRLRDSPPPQENQLEGNNPPSPPQSKPQLF